MVNESKILTAIKNRLDGSVDFRKAVKQVGSSSKVILGSSESMTQLMPLPYVRIIIPTNEIGIVMSESNALIYFNIHSRSLNTGVPDYDEIENIGAAIYDLIQDVEITVENHNIFSIYVEAKMTVVKDRNQDNTYMGGLQCRTHAIRYS